MLKLYYDFDLHNLHLVWLWLRFLLLRLTHGSVIYIFVIYCLDTYHGIFICRMILDTKFGCSVLEGISFIGES